MGGVFVDKQNRFSLLHHQIGVQHLAYHPIGAFSQRDFLLRQRILP